MRGVQWIGVVIATVAVAITGCVSESVTLSAPIHHYGSQQSLAKFDGGPSPESSPGPVAPTPVAGGASAGVAVPMRPGSLSCVFSISDINDLRSYRRNLGYAATTTVQSNDLTQWIRSGFASLPGYSDQPVGVSLKVDIIKAYMQSVATMKSADIVLRVKIQALPSAGSEKVYRGADDSMNWDSGASEVQSAFDRALSDVLDQVEHDLSTNCSSSAGHADAGSGNAEPETQPAPMR